MCFKFLVKIVDIDPIINNVDNELEIIAKNNNIPIYFTGVKTDITREIKAIFDAASKNMGYPTSVITFFDIEL